jgi:hypothetical protein
MPLRAMPLRANFLGEMCFAQAIKVSLHHSEDRRFRPQQGLCFPVSKLLRRLSCCLRLLQDSRVPLHHGSITSRASLSRFPSYHGFSAAVFAFYKTLGFRFTMEVLSRVSLPRFQVALIHSQGSSSPTTRTSRLSCCRALSRL